MDALLDLNREAQNHCDPYNGERDVRMVARIPLIVIAKWRNELGVDYWNPDHQDKVDALLNDADWRWLRTDGGSSRFSLPGARHSVPLMSCRGKTKMRHGVARSQQHEEGD